MSHACCGEPEVGALRRADPEMSAAQLDDAVSAVANALAFAAAPTFALLALWTAFAGDRSACSVWACRETSSLNGMALMYALMSAFHATPWLRLISRR